MEKLIKIVTVILIASTIGVANAEEPKPLEATIEDLSQNIADQMASRGVTKIAIDNFTDLNGYESAVGDFIAEEMVTNFYILGKGKLEVVERKELSRVLKEQELGERGLINKDTIAKVGEILGVDAIVMGKIAYLGDTVKISVRLIGVSDAKIFAASAMKAKKIKLLMPFSGRLVAGHRVHLEALRFNLLKQSTKISF